MTVHLDGDATISPDSKAYRYFRNAVERHWDPHDIDLSADAERIGELDDGGFAALRRTLGLFGAGEEAVTEDLAPLACVLEDIEDQLFVTSQMYEEAKHADFFQRYWSEVIAPEEARRDDRAGPTSNRWYSADYVELFDRTEAAMNRLLTEDTPETRAEAYCHYHLTVEGVLAQTGYYGVQQNFAEDTEFDTPHMPGLVEGFTQIRGDEGRHVGFGMAKLKELVEEEGVDPQLLHDTVGELVPLTQGIVSGSIDEDTPGPTEDELVAYATDKHTQRMQQITDASADIPDVETLTKLADD